MPADCKVYGLCIIGFAAAMRSFAKLLWTLVMTTIFRINDKPPRRAYHVRFLYTVASKQRTSVSAPLYYNGRHQKRLTITCNYRRPRPLCHTDAPKSIVSLSHPYPFAETACDAGGVPSRRNSLRRRSAILFNWSACPTPFRLPIALYKSLFTENSVATQKHCSTSINTNKIQYKIQRSSPSQ